MTKSLCPIQSARWKATELPREQLHVNHQSRAGDDGAPVFARLAAWFEKMPTSDLDWEGDLPTAENRNGDRRRVEAPCECGGPSAWTCATRVYNHFALGGGRIGRTGRGFTVYPEDPAINAAILGVANKYIEPHFEDGLPCEEFRDLCNELATRLHTYADGTVTTYFLPQEAAAYLRSTNAAQTWSTNQLLRHDFYKRRHHDEPN